VKALQDLDIFVRTVDSGSLSATARALDLTPAAASAALKRLEEELGVQLLVRSTRSLRLTPQGEQFLEHCRPALDALQQAGRQLASGSAGLQGVLKLAAPSDLGRNVLLPWLDAFQQQHPGVDLRVQLSDRMANIYSDPVDAAVRYGKPPDSGLVALPLAPWNRRVLCASPGYVARRGAPADPQALSAHDGLCFMLGDEVHDRWRFHAPARSAEPEVVVRVRARNVSNDGDLVHRWALMGRGIAYKAGLDVAADIAAGRLVALCTQWTTEASPLFLVVPSRRQLTPLLRALRDFLAARLAEPAAAAEVV
jgi:DNA-binding transcriptional LysR family regulator